MAEAPAKWTSAPDGPAVPKDAAAPDAEQGPAPSTRIANENEAARRAFHRALEAERRPQPPPARSSRNAAMRAFFVANAGRALLPGNEASGALAPQIRDEEA